MKKGTKLKTALFLLAAATNMTYASESCVPPKKGQTPLDVLECLQKGLDKQQHQISELKAENKAQQDEIQALKLRLSLSEGLVAHYPFDGDANDVSGHGHHGEVHGGIQYVDGILGKAAEFNGNTSYILVPDDDRLNIEHLTLSAWVYDYHHTGSSYMILLKGIWSSGEQKRQYEFSSTYGAKPIVNFGLFSSSQRWENIRSTIPFLVKQWRLLVVTYDGQQLKMYIDGELHNSRDVITKAFIPKVPAPLIIGGGFNAALNKRYGREGLIDDLRIFNRALTKVEIQALYKQPQLFLNKDK